jgi:hypothetical protein
VPARLIRARGHTHTSVTMVDVIISGAPVRAEMARALADFFPADEPQSSAAPRASAAPQAHVS